MDADLVEAQRQELAGKRRGENAARVRDLRGREAVESDPRGLVDVECEGRPRRQRLPGGRERRDDRAHVGLEIVDHGPFRGRLDHPGSEMDLVGTDMRAHRLPGPEICRA